MGIDIGMCYTSEGIERLGFSNLSFYIGTSNYCMKKLILSILLLPLAGRSGSDNSIEIRAGEWPINLESSGATYSLIFRDQGVMNSVVLDTLPFPNIEQLRYFDKALSTLKTGNNGDIARFTTYSIKRADKKFDGLWYILKTKYSTTDFRQSEADAMSKAIRGF